MLLSYLLFMNGRTDKISEMGISVKNPFVLSKASETTSVAVVAAWQLPAAEASADCEAQARPAAQQASATNTAAAVTPTGTGPATTRPFYDVVKRNLGVTFFDAVKKPAGQVLHGTAVSVSVASFYF